MGKKTKKLSKAKQLELSWQAILKKYPDKVITKKVLPKTLEVSTPYRRETPLFQV